LHHLTVLYGDDWNTSSEALADEPPDLAELRARR
jgi:hypothetical protein